MPAVFADIPPSPSLYVFVCPIVAVIAAVVGLAIGGLWIAKRLRQKPPGPGRTP